MRPGARALGVLRGLFASGDRGAARDAQATADAMPRDQVRRLELRQKRRARLAAGQKPRPFLGWKV